MGLMTSFGVGVAGLRTANNSLNATAHNLTNVDTKGYVRQQVLTVDLGYSDTQTVARLDQTGRGSIVAKIRQVRDRFLDDSYRRESGREGFYRSQTETMQEIESLFGELEGTTFQSEMNNLWTAVQELQKEPESLVARTSLVETANTFIDRCDSITSQLKSFRQDINLKIENTVNRLNEIAHKIDNLNMKIRTYESGEQEANDLRDERNKLLDELGVNIKISYKETSDGTVLVNAEGTQFVTEFGVNEIGLRDTDDELKLHTPVWKFDINDKKENREVFNLDIPPTVSKDTDIGYLKGLLLSRGRQGRYVDIPEEPKLSNYDGIDDEYYKRAIFNYEKAKEEYNNKIAPSVLTNAEAQFDRLIHGITTMLNEVLSPNITFTWSDDGEVIAHNSLDKRLTEEEVAGLDLNFDLLKDVAVKERDALGNETGRYRISILDEKAAPVSMDSSKVMGNALFERKGMKRYRDVEIDGRIFKVYNEEDYNIKDEQSKYSLFSLGEVEVNRNIRENVSLIPLSYNTNTGDFSMDVAARLNEVWDKKFATISPNTLTKNNFLEYYTAYTADLANSGATFRAISKSQEVTMKSVDNQRQQVIGASSDEELTHLIKFQQAFNAASRYITVIDQMLEHIIVTMGM